MYYKKLICFLSAGILLVSCAATPVKLLTPQVVIINQTAQVISVIQYQSCNASQEDWSVINNSRLQSGRLIQFVIPTDCVNLRAYYDGGKVAGQQSEIRRSFPTSWVLR